MSDAPPPPPPLPPPPAPDLMRIELLPYTHDAREWKPQEAQHAAEGGREALKSDKTSEAESAKAKAKPPPAPDAKPPKQFLQELPTPASFRDAAWFVVSGGDLRFAHTLLARAQGLADMDVLYDAELIKRVYALHVVGKKVLHELQGRSARQADDEASEGGHAILEEEEEEVAPSPSTTACDGNGGWTVASIIQEVREVLTVSHVALLKEESERPPNAKKQKRSVERALVKELTENATELLLSRAVYADISVLEAWLAFISMDPAKLKKQVESADVDTEKPETSEETVAVQPEGGDNRNPSKRNLKRQQKQQRQSAKSAASIACEHVRVCIEFLREYHKVAAAGSSVHESKLLRLQPPAFQVSHDLERELRDVFEMQRIRDADEGERLGITQHLQQVLRRQGGFKWQSCELVLFGSSLSLYGSNGSDMDLCLLRSSATASAAKTVVGTRAIRAILNDRVENESNDMVAVQELNLQVQKSIQKVTILYHDKVRDGPEACSHSQLKMLQELRCIRAHYSLLQDAIRDRVLAISANEADGQETARAVAAAAAARMKELVLKSRRQSEDMFRVRAILERSNCKVRMVISGARIPIIRFQHLPTEVECDMCFENVLATRNTFLLRAYAEFDERARVLGIAVKHWAKQRAINDASIGFLSSYSFVLLTIYFLQAVAGVLPNLQDPELLAAANVTPEMYNGVNIAFCTKQAVARAFHAKQQQAIAKDLLPRTREYSVAVLLVWFFEFYATKFDFARHVISIRSPDECTEKLLKWGAQKTRSWRISIQDPLEISRDLGSVLKLKGQEKILHEFKRAYEMVKAGKSFAEIAKVGNAPPTTTGKKVAEAAAKKVAEAAAKKVAEAAAKKVAEAAAKKVAEAAEKKVAEAAEEKVAEAAELQHEKKPAKPVADTNRSNGHSEDADVKPKKRSRNKSRSRPKGNRNKAADTASTNASANKVDNKNASANKVDNKNASANEGDNKNPSNTGGDNKNPANTGGGSKKANSHNRGGRGKGEKARYVPKNRRNDGAQERREANSKVAAEKVE